METVQEFNASLLKATSIRWKGPEN